jgi:hypothetical protein
LSPLPDDRVGSELRQQLCRLSLRIVGAMSHGEVHRHNAHEGSASGNKRCGLHGAKAKFLSGCSIRRKFPVCEHVLDNDRTSGPYRAAARRSVVRSDLGKAPDKVFVEAAVRRDGEVPELPVYQLNISASGAIYLQAPGQGGIQHGPQVATPLQLRRYKIAYITQYHAATSLEAGRELCYLSD